MSFLPIEHSPLTDEDIAKLLNYLGGIDGQDHSDAADFTLWKMAANASGWTRAEAIAGVIVLMREFTRFMIKPPDMQQAVLEVRRVVRERWDPPPPPRELCPADPPEGEHHAHGDGPRREREWRRAALRDFRERAIYALAQGQDLASVPMLSPAFAGRAELPAAPGGAAEQQARAAMEAFIERAGVATAELAVAARTRRRRTALDPDVMDAVRRDLAARAPIPLPGEDGGLLPDPEPAEQQPGEDAAAVGEPAAAE